MFEKLQKLFRSSEPSETDVPVESSEDVLTEAPLEEVLPAELVEIGELPVVRQGNIVRLNTDELSEEGRAAFAAAMAEEFGESLFVGKIENGYSFRAAGNPEKCPKCHSPTKSHIANVIYATDIAPRVMFMNGVYFCTACPTVIVNEEVVQQGMSKEFEYRGLVGLDFEGKASPSFFKYWNGQQMIVLMDEETGYLELVQKNRLGMPRIPMAAGSTRQSPKKKSSRTAMVKKSRKQNRKKK